MFFSGLFQRKSDAPVTTPAELADAIGLSYDTYTGKQISSQRAMRLTAVFSCVRVLAESVGMLPCNLYHLNGSLKQRATGERLHKLISTHPNGYMTPQEFWELVVTCLCLRGNFYAYKVKAFGEVAELLPVDPGCVVPAPTTSAVMQNAAVGQATTPAQSTGWPSVTHPALNNAPAVKNTVDLPTWEELTDIRDTLNTAIDKELSRTTSDALFLALRRVKADLNADINTRLEQSARIIQRTPDEVLPALVLAATWFDNAARDADIIRRNAITHPGFVPVIPLKVPVQ